MRDGDFARYRHKARWIARCAMHARLQWSTGVLLCLAALTPTRCHDLPLPRPSRPVRASPGMFHSVFGSSLSLRGAGERTAVREPLHVQCAHADPDELRDCCGGKTDNLGALKAASKDLRTYKEETRSLGTEMSKESRSFGKEKLISARLNECKWACLIQKCKRF